MEDDNKDNPQRAAFRSNRLLRKMLSKEDDSVVQGSAVRRGFVNYGNLIVMPGGTAFPTRPDISSSAVLQGHVKEIAEDVKVVGGHRSWSFTSMVLIIVFLCLGLLGILVPTRPTAPSPGPRELLTYAFYTNNTFTNVFIAAATLPRLANMSISSQQDIAATQPRIPYLTTLESQVGPLTSNLTYIRGNFTLLTTSKCYSLIPELAVHIYGTSIALGRTAIDTLNQIDAAEARNAYHQKNMLGRWTYPWHASTYDQERRMVEHEFSSQLLPIMQRLAAQARCLDSDINAVYNNLKLAQTHVLSVLSAVNVSRTAYVQGQLENRTANAADAAAAAAAKSRSWSLDSWVRSWLDTRSTAHSPPPTQQRCIVDSDTKFRAHIQQHKTMYDVLTDVWYGIAMPLEKMQSEFLPATSAYLNHVVQIGRNLEALSDIGEYPTTLNEDDTVGSDTHTNPDESSGVKPGVQGNAAPGEDSDGKANTHVRHNTAGTAGQEKLQPKVRTVARQSHAEADRIARIVQACAAAVWVVKLQ